MNNLRFFLLVALVFIGSAPATAQQREPARFVASHLPALDFGAPQDTLRVPGPLRPIRLAKWTALATAAASSVYGFIQNSRADSRYRDLEVMCQAQPIRCADRTAAGTYTDPVFESQYQSIRSLDRRSHFALVASQVGVATSVVLFLLDLGNGRSPADKPYTPPSVRAARDADDRVTISVHLRLPGGPAPHQ